MGAGRGSLPAREFKGQVSLAQALGRAHNYEAERVVIVGYNRASPAVKTATLRSDVASFFFPLD